MISTKLLREKNTGNITLPNNNVLLNKNIKIRDEILKKTK